MKDFKYDVVELIDLIRERPCLWDKTIDNYKDRVERRAAWEEIFNVLEKNYENQSPEEKRVTGEYILNKWTNVRDTFVKSLKPRPNNKQKKRYLYYKNLKFLIKVIPKDEISEENLNETNYQEVTLKEEDDDDDDIVNDGSTSSSYNVKKRPKLNYSDAEEDYANYEVRKKSKKSSSFVENDTKATEVTLKTLSPDFVGIDESDPRVMNEDEAFFASLLPTVVKYDEDERLEFRIEVLKVMKKIKEKRNWPGTSYD